MMQIKIGKNTGMVIDGVAACEAVDGSNEVLSVKGCDISDWEAGKGLCNWEHGSEDSPQQIVGKIVYCKKIYRPEDCETDRERAYLEKVRGLPYIYVICRLYDAADSPSARALAAQIRDHVAHDDMIMCRFSIEGTTLSKEGIYLKETVARRLSVTVKPCNHTCNTGLLLDPRAPEGFDKRPGEPDPEGLLGQLLARSDNPEYTKLGGSVGIDIDPVFRAPGEDAVRALVKSMVLLKAITAGTPGGTAPSELTGGAALQRTGPHPREVQMRSALRDFGHRVGPHNRNDFKKFSKHYLPDVDEGFLDRFADAAAGVRLGKHEDVARMERLAIELGIAAEALRKDAEMEAPTSEIRSRPDVAPPRDRFASPILDAQEHGLMIDRPEQHDLVHGADISANAERPSHAGSGMQGHQARWIKLGDGRSAFVKPDLRFDPTHHRMIPDDYSSARREAAYHNLAHSVFGLGHHVPVTAAFTDPSNGMEHSIQEGVPGAEHLDEETDYNTGEQVPSAKHGAILKKLHGSGDLDKMAMMNLIMGNNDRHAGNYVFSDQREPGMFLIDNGLSLRNPHTMAPPGYLHDTKPYGMVDTLHPAALKWLIGLDPEHFESEMLRQGLPAHQAEQHRLRMEGAQAAAREGLTSGGRVGYDEVDSGTRRFTRHGG